MFVEETRETIGAVCRAFADGASAKRLEGCVGMRAERDGAGAARVTFWGKDGWGFDAAIDGDLLLFRTRTRDSQGSGAVPIPTEEDAAAKWHEKAIVLSRAFAGAVKRLKECSGSEDVDRILGYVGTSRRELEWVGFDVARFDGGAADEG